MQPARLTTALEHIVIDLPINAAALGPGLHSVTVPTNGLVFWRAEIAKQPAWLRLTLSDRPANKPLVSWHAPVRRWPRLR